MKNKYYLRGIGIGMILTALIMGLTAGKSGKLSDEEIINRAKQLGMVEDNKVLTDLSNEEETLVAQGKPEESGEPQTDDNDPVSVETVEESKEENTEQSEETSVEISEESTEESMEETTEESTEESMEETTEESTEASTEESSSEEIPEESQAETKEETQEETSPEKESLVSEESTEETQTDDSVVTIVVKRGTSSVGISKELEKAGLVEDAAAYDAFLCKHGYDKKISIGEYQIPKGSTEEEIAKMITGKK